MARKSKDGFVIVRRECDEAMARKKRMLPCENKKCKTCIACIEIDVAGNRDHVRIDRG